MGLGAWLVRGSRRPGYRKRGRHMRSPWELGNTKNCKYNIGSSGAVIDDGAVVEGGENGG